jgi:hypothetical protein
MLQLALISGARLDLPTPDCGREVPHHGRMPELVFEVVQEADGGYCA